MVLSGSATLAFTSPTTGVLSGTWKIEEATGRYASLEGTGTLSGEADFGAVPPTASLDYHGTLATR